MCFAHPFFHPPHHHISAHSKPCNEPCIVTPGAGRDDELLTSHQRASLELTRADLATMRPGEWLNDECINMYMALLQVGVVGKCMNMHVTLLQVCTWNVTTECSCWRQCLHVSCLLITLSSVKRLFIVIVSLWVSKHHRHLHCQCCSSNENRLPTFLCSQPSPPGALTFCCIVTGC